MTIATVAMVALATLTLVGACDDGEDGGGDPTPTAMLSPSPTAEAQGTTAAAMCAAAGQTAGSVASPELVEVSGIAASRGNEGVLWAHNDSGDTARVFAMSMTGAHLAEYQLAGAGAVDWEDMAIGPGPVEGVGYLYLADIGDNQAQRPEITVYRVREPEVQSGSAPETSELTDVEALTLRYPDGAHDAETLLVDPLSGDLNIVTKDVATGIGLVFRAPGELEAGSTTTLERVGEIDFSALREQIEVPAGAPPLVAGVPHLPTGGDVSPDGRLVVIRTYGAVFVWSRPAGGTLSDAFAGMPCQAPSAVEAQGEAIAFDWEGAGYFTVSEGQNPPISDFVAER